MKMYSLCQLYFTVQFLSNFLIMQSQHELNIIDKLLEEAYERQLEIVLLAEQESQALKTKLLTQQMDKIDQQYKQLTRLQLLQQRILKSTVKHHYRMLKIKKKYQLCEEIFKQVQEQLHIFSKSEEKQEEYKLFLVSSIVEGLIRMFQDKINIRALEKDLPILEELIPYINQAYKYFMNLQIGRQYEVQLNIAKNMRLEPKQQTITRELHKNEQQKMCIGGVILSDETGNISYKATLDCRLSILKQLCLPEIREMIWEVPKEKKQPESD